MSADSLNRDTPTVFMEAVSDFFTAVFTSCPYCDRNFPSSPNFFVWKMWISVVVGAGGLLGHALAAPDIHAKRSVLSDLSNGFYHSWKFGSVITNNILHLNGLDGGLLPGDSNANNTYLVNVDLTKAFNLSDGSAYKLSVIPTSVPNLKDQALWSSQDNSTLFAYGGRGASNTALDNGVWEYDLKNQQWNLQTTSVKPVRLEGGSHANAPSINAAFWVGGFQSSDTTPAITNATLEFATGMLRFNTSTQSVDSLPAPFTPVQNGALNFLNIGGGLLVYIGGETPEKQDGANMTFTVNDWSHVWVYSIAYSAWFNQSTSGVAPSRTDFCTVSTFDDSTKTFQIWVIGGADFNSRNVLSDVSFLSIPSFRWYQANPTEGLYSRMSMSCEVYGSQILGIGGRLEWDEGAGAGSYGSPAFVYDANQQEVVSSFRPSATSYGAPSSVTDNVMTSPYPSSWADPTLRAIFVSPTPSPSPSSSSPQATISQSDSNSLGGGAIAGAVIAGITVFTISSALVWFLMRRRRQWQQRAPADAKSKEDHPADHNAVPAEVHGDALPYEFDATAARSELDATQKFVQLPSDELPRHELA